MQHDVARKQNLAGTSAVSLICVCFDDRDAGEIRMFYIHFEGTPALCSPLSADSSQSIMVFLARSLPRAMYGDRQQYGQCPQAANLSHCLKWLQRIRHYSVPFHLGALPTPCLAMPALASMVSAWNHSLFSPTMTTGGRKSHTFEGNSMEESAVSKGESIAYGKARAGVQALQYVCGTERTQASCCVTQYWWASFGET